MEAPVPYKNAGIMMMFAGVVNIIQAMFLGLTIFGYATAAAISTFGLGIVCYACMLWPLFPLTMGLIELIMGIRAMSGQRVPGMRQVSTFGIIAGALNLALIPLVLEIVVMSQLGDRQSVDYLEEGIY